MVLDVVERWGSLARQLIGTNLVTHIPGRTPHSRTGRARCRVETGRSCAREEGGIGSIPSRHRSPSTTLRNSAESRDRRRRFGMGGMGSGHREFAMTLGYIHGAHGARQETPARRPNQVLNKRLGEQPQHPEIGTVASLASRETCGHASVFLQPTPRAESCSTDDPSRPTWTTSDEPANSHQHKRLLPPERRPLPIMPRAAPETDTPARRDMD